MGSVRMLWVHFLDGERGGLPGVVGCMRGKRSAWVNGRKLPLG